MLSKKITVLYPILHYPPVIGGLEQWAENIAENQHGSIGIIVVTGRVKGEPTFEKKSNVLIVRSSLFALNNLSRSSRLYILTSMLYIFFRSFILIFQQKVDIIHCHGFMSAIMGCLLGALTGRPFIGTEQSLGWSSGSSKLLRRMVYRRARLCISASRAVRDEFRKLGGVERIKIIPNGIDTKKFFPQTQCRLCQKPNLHRSDEGDWVSRTPHTILAVGRLEKVKGHTYLIEAFARIKKEMSDAKLILVGDGSERDNLEILALELGIKDSVQFLGEVPHDDLPHYYHKARLFVMPSLSEGFGITVIEAMASGVPVVATSAGSLMELVKNEKTGLLVKPQDAESLARALRFMIDNPKEAEYMAEQGCEAASLYSWDMIARKVGNLYKRILLPRVLISTSIAPPAIGGPSYYAKNLARELRIKGYKISIATGREAASFKKIFFKLRTCKICYTLSSSPKILLPGFCAAKLLGRKLALRIGGDFLWERAIENGRTDLPIRVFYEEYNKSFRETIIFYTLGFLFRRCDFIIFSSDFLRSKYSQYYKLDNSKVHLVENPYPAVEKKERSFPKELTMLYAGRLIKLKNIDSLLYALKDVKDAVGANILLKIIGDGPQEDRLVKIVFELGLEKQVTIKKALSQDALLWEIKKSWLVILPSLSEVTPNLVLESCAAGTPVIVTRENGLAKSISGYLMNFDPKNKKELSFVIISLLNKKRWQDYQKIILRLDTSRSFKDAASEHACLFK